MDAIDVRPDLELDASVATIRAHMASMVSSAYDCALAVKDCYDRQLWKRRPDARGKQKHATWADFVKNELGMSDTWSRMLMRVTAVPRERVEAVGVAKTILIIKAPVSRADKDDLFERAIAGHSKGQLQHRVETIRGRTVASPRPVGRPARAPDAPRMQRAVIELHQHKGSATHCGEITIAGKRLYLKVRVSDDEKRLEAEVYFG